MRLVCDTNVLIAALVADGLCRDIVKRRFSSHELFTSTALLHDLREKIRNKFETDPDCVPFIRAYQERAVVIAALPLPKQVCRDRDDDEVLAVAVAASADLIITGDEDLLVLKNFEGTVILSPRGFVEHLDKLP